MTRPRHRWARLAAGLFLCALLAALAGCAQLVPQTMALRTGWPAGVPQHVELAHVPFFPQDDYQCGPAALATVLAVQRRGRDARRAGEPGLPAGAQGQPAARDARHGAALRPRLLRAGPALRRPAARSGGRQPGHRAAGRRSHVHPVALRRGQRLRLLDSGTLFLRSGTTARQEMPFTAFEREWMKSGYWAMVVTPPDRIPVTATEEGWMAAVLAMARSGDGERRHAGLCRGTASAGPTTCRPPSAWPTSTMRAARWRKPPRCCARRRQRHPQSVIVMNNLAQTLSDQGRHAEALAQIDKAARCAKPLRRGGARHAPVDPAAHGQRKAGNR